MAIKYGIWFALPHKWLTFLLINEFLETSNEDVIYTKVNLKKKTKEEEESETTQVTSKD